MKTFTLSLITKLYEPPHDKTNKMACAPTEDSDQPGHPPSLIRVFLVRMRKAWVLSYPLSAQRRLWSDCADAQADLSLRWAQCYFVCFVMSRLIWLDSRDVRVWQSELSRKFNCSAKTSVGNQLDIFNFMWTPTLTPKLTFISNE